MTEMTRRDFFKAVIGADIDAELKLFAEREIEKMDERNAKRKEKPSKKSVENEPIKEKIVDFVGGCETPQIASVIAENVEISVQKASALCRQLVDVDTFKVTEVKVKGKGKVKAYSLA